MSLISLNQKGAGGLGMQVSVEAPGSGGSTEGLSSGCGGALPRSPPQAGVVHSLTLLRMLVANSDRPSLFLEIAADQGHTCSRGNPHSVMVNARVQRPGPSSKATGPCSPRAPRGMDRGLCCAA